MKRLILVRHAKTEAFTSSSSDFGRRLKNRGHADSILVATELRNKGYYPQVIISSPAVRAMQTAENMAKSFSIPQNDILVAPFIYDGHTTAGFIDGIVELAKNNDTIMVVGHNPDMAMLAMRLTNESFINFPTTATVVISFAINKWHQMEPGKGKLELFVFPKMLKE